MARRKSRSSAGSQQSPTAQAAAEAPAIESFEPDAADPEALEPINWKVIGTILGGCALASLFLLAASWGGYQIRRATAKAEIALEEDRFADAVPHLEFLIEEFPEAWVRLTQLGDCYLELGRGEEALAAYESSLAVEPKQALDAQRGRALFLADPADPRARQLLEAALAVEPFNSRTNFYLALVEFEQGAFQEAAKFFNAASADEKIFERSKPYLEKIRKELLGR